MKKSKPCTPYYMRPAAKIFVDFGPNSVKLRFHDAWEGFATHGKFPWTFERSGNMSQAIPRWFAIRQSNDRCDIEAFVGSECPTISLGGSSRVDKPQVRAYDKGQSRQRHAKERTRYGWRRDGLASFRIALATHYRKLMWLFGRFCYTALRSKRVANMRDSVITLYGANDVILSQVTLPACKRFSIQAARNQRKLDVMYLQHPSAIRATIDNYDFFFKNGKSQCIIP